MAIISDDFIRRLSLGGKAELVVRDNRLTGFALRVRRRTDGKLSHVFFVFQEMPAAPDGTRKRRKIVIGTYPEFPADKAREVAQGMLQAVAKGDDPAAEKAAKKARPLLKTLAEDFEATHVASLKLSSQWDYKGRIRRRLLPEFGEKRVSDITIQEVRDWHRRIGRQHPTDANRSLAILSKMMTHAIEAGWRVDNPCKAVKRFPEKTRDAWLDEHDMPAFVAALAKADGPYSDLIRFLTVTGWRISEARTLTWDMVDLKRLIARLPDTKTGASERSLSTDAATIIDGQKHRTGFVFSKRGTMPLDYRTILLALRDICATAEIAPITPHVLRHSAATWAAIEGAQAHEIKEAFGWKTLAMTSRYVSRSEALGRRGVERAAGAINIFQKPPAPVESLSSRKR